MCLVDLVLRIKKGTFKPTNETFACYEEVNLFLSSAVGSSSVILGIGEKFYKRQKLTPKFLVVTNNVRKEEIEAQDTLCRFYTLQPSKLY